MKKSSPQKLSHYDDAGNVRMVEVTAKDETVREAVAGGFVKLSPRLVKIIRKGGLAKGDPLEIARIAGIMAAKRTHELIPLCHQLLLTKVDVSLVLTDAGVEVESRVKCIGKTGVEMEALTAVSVAALTIYDMCKAVDKGMTIDDIHLKKKTGGKSGEYTNPSDKR